MADPISHPKPHLELKNSKPITKSNKSASLCSRILCKSLFVVLFLVLIPLFPSQTPEFINHNLLTKLWDLVHLLFVGLAVCYGLFSRRNVEDFDFEPPPQSSDDSQSSYVSRIFHVSPIFDDGSENQSGFGEKNGYQNWNSQYYKNESMVSAVSNAHEENKTGLQYYRDGTMVGDANGSEQNKNGSLGGVENGFENSFEINNGDSDVIQAWNSQYFQGESMVVVSQPNLSLDAYGNLGQGNGYEPLGLPIRSLNSGVNRRISNGSEVDSSMTGSSGSSGRSGVEKDFGNMGPSNLEERFNETLPLYSKIPWRSRSERKEIREEVGSSVAVASHFRPHSVDETQSESLASQGSWDARHLGPSHFRPLSVDEAQFESLTSQGRHLGPSHFRSLSVDETQFESLQSQSFMSTTSLLSQGSLGAQHLGPSHFRPFSVDETQFEHLQNQSFRSTTPFSSQASLGTQHLGPSHFRPLSVDETQFDSLKSQSFRSTTSMSSQGVMGGQHVGPSHFRPLSVDETQFESLKSQSFRSTKSLSSQGSSASYSPTTLSPSHSVSSELPNSENEELGKEKGYCASYPPASQPPSTRKADAPLNAFHLRRYSSGPLFRKESRRSLKDELKDLKGKINGNPVGSGETGKGSLRSDQKPATPVKSSASKGKSVRTIRIGGYAVEATKAGEMSRNHIDNKVGTIYDEAKAVNTGNSGMKKKPDNMPTGTAKNNLDTRHRMPIPTLPEYKKKEKEVLSEIVTAEPAEDSESEIDNFQASSEEDASTGTKNDAGDDLSEVDKKASEFIAKFREQIRLQKVASIERSKGKRMNGTQFR